MSEDGLRKLHEYELRLLRCSISPPTSDSAPLCRHPDTDESHCSLHYFINDILTSIEAGNYLEALSSDAARQLILSHDSDFSDSFESAERAYTDLLARVESFVTDDSSDDDEKSCRVILVICVAVAAFFWFTRCNMTGPIEGLPRRHLPIRAWREGTEMVEWENWARIQLISVGSDLLGKFSFLQYLVFAKMLLFKMRDLLFGTSLLSTSGMRSISWWLHRFLLIHQRILDERSSSLFDLLQVFSSETLGHFGTLDKVKSYFDAKLQEGEASAIVSVIHLEAAIMDHIYGWVDSCRVHLGSAEVAAGLQLSVTGVLGLRTMHQVEPKAQRVLVSNISSMKIVDGCSSANGGILSDDNRAEETSDILMTPKLLDDDSDSGNKLDSLEGHGAFIGVLTPIQQAVVLAHCLSIEKSSRHDEMQRWDMAPYIEAIDSQQSSHFIIRCFCDILRIRWESTRNRTKERALGMMDKLVEGVRKSYPGAEERLPLCFATYFPSIPALRKEYAVFLVSCGVVGEAIRTFEDLELWDNLIYCYSLLDKKAAAVELIKKRLCEVPNDPKLLCSLGDVTQDENCYEKALEVSHNKSARAKRSLARGAYERGDYEKSKILWGAAMALNSLYPDGWFALGAAALKARDIEKALDAFTRAVQVDPENGEAWNNIACLHMIKKKNKESFIAFKEALKFKRNSWELWENYSHVALDVGNVGQALEALQMVLRITKNKRIDTDFLGKVMLMLEERIAGQSAVARDVPANFTDSNGYTEVTGTAVGTSRETEQLVEVFGRILQQIVRSESRADIWGVYARWHRIKGDLLMCCEALLKQVRSFQGSDLWKDRERFGKFASASLELCNVYMEISSNTGSKRELFSAEMHLKNVLKQAENFSGTQEFSGLQSCLDEVKARLQPQSNHT